MTLWGGRFGKKMDEDAWRFNASIGIDFRLAAEDVHASMAWANQLYAAQIIAEDDLKLLLSGLNTIGLEIKTNQFRVEPFDEDIHSAVERRLYELIGDPAGRLHTGRSRNDQVATDFRLWIMKQIPVLNKQITKLQTLFIELAERDFGMIMPSYTHLQRAQPILLSHWWLSWLWGLERDKKRFNDAAEAASELPLGSGAVAGCGFLIDRNNLAAELNFHSISQNSLDAVANRDFAVQFLFAITLCCQHLSRLAEQVILFSSSEFGFFGLDDAYATGSSLMPQKKNADIFELSRGKTGTVIGLLTGLLATLKGLPSTYDKDLQEDKKAVFDAYDTLSAILTVVRKALENMKVDDKKMRNSIDSFTYATDIADELVESGFPFREAHALTGNVVHFALERGLQLNEIEPSDWSRLIPNIEKEWSLWFSPEKSVSRRKSAGGTAPEQVQDQIKLARNMLAEYNSNTHLKE